MTKERLALLTCAPQFQGGHSRNGQIIAEALGIKFPITMKKLATCARKDGLDPKKLWPWLDSLAVPPAERAES